MIGVLTAPGFVRLGRVQDAGSFWQAVFLTRGIPVPSVGLVFRVVTKQGKLRLTSPIKGSLPLKAQWVVIPFLC